jgi:guanylate kinase
MRPDPLYITISGPSGVGKSTVLEAATKILPDAARVPLVTTRARRVSEFTVSHYRYVDPSEFTRLNSQGLLVTQAATYGDEMYGLEYVALAHLANHEICFIDLGLHNLQTFRAKFDCISVLLLAPTREEGSRRLRDRGSESIHSNERRETAAVALLDHAADFDYVTVNMVVDSTAIYLANVARWELNRREEKAAGERLAFSQANELRGQ